MRKSKSAARITLYLFRNGEFQSLGEVQRVPNPMDELVARDRDDQDQPRRVIPTLRLEGQFDLPPDCINRFLYLLLDGWVYKAYCASYLSDLDKGTTTANFKVEEHYSLEQWEREIKPQAVEHPTADQARVRRFGDPYRGGW